MSLSLNVWFQANEYRTNEHFDPGYDYEHFRGEGLLGFLSTGMIEQKWSFSELDFWRDCGWSVICRRGDAELEIILVPILDVECHKKWMLQIKPKRIPFLGRLLGSKPSASPNDVYQLAIDINTILVQVDSFHNPCWCWDGPPDDKNSTPIPPPPQLT